MLYSATSNAENNDGADVDELKVTHDHRRRRRDPEALHGPRQRPRQSQIFKRTSHITVVVGSGK